MSWVDSWLQGLSCPRCGGILSISTKACHSCGHNFHKGGKGSGGGINTVHPDYQAPKIPSSIIDHLDLEDSGDMSVVAKGLGIDYGTLKHWSDLNQEWTSGANREAKESIAEMVKYNPKLRALSLHEWYTGDMTSRMINRSGEFESFSSWLEKPQTLYRVGGVHPPFSSFTTSERRARDASGYGEGGDAVTKISLAPKHVLASWGSGEQYVEPEALTGY